MTAAQVAAALPVITAFAERRPIQYRSQDPGSMFPAEWMDINPDTTEFRITKWDLAEGEWRVKPNCLNERPIKTFEELHDLTDTDEPITNWDTREQEEVMTYYQGSGATVVGLLGVMQFTPSAWSHKERNKLSNKLGIPAW